MALSVKPPTSAQVMISRFVGSSPTVGSVLTAQSLEPASDSVSPSLCPSPVHALSLSVSNFAQVVISRSVSSSPASGSGLMARSLEPVSDSVSPSFLSAPPPFMLCLSLSQK